VQETFEAMFVIAQFVPFVIVMAIANLEHRQRAFRTVALLILLSFNLLFIGVGLGSMAMPRLLAQRPDDISWPFDTQWANLAFTALLTGLVASLMLLPSVRRIIARVPGMRLDADSAVHTTALSFAIYLVGLTLGQLYLVGSLQGLAEAAEFGLNLTPTLIWAQGIGIALVALAGIGLAVRRDLRAAVKRLGLGWPREEHVSLIVGFWLLFLALDFGWAHAWQALDPGSYETVGRVSRGLMEGLTTFSGALAVGFSAGISEELVFRGALQPRFGLVLSSALFAVSHLQYSFSPALGEVFLLGLGLGYLRRRANLTAAILVHAGYNFTLVMLSSIWP